MEQLTVYDLGAEDHELDVELLSAKEVFVSIKNEDGDLVYEERSHIFAWESLVRFATQIIVADHAIQRELEVIEDDE